MLILVCDISLDLVQDSSVSQGRRSAANHGLEVATTLRFEPGCNSMYVDNITLVMRR
jgi:hypothetical protein